MSLFKKVTAFLTAFGVAAGLTGCGSNTTQALEVNGYSVPAGVYIYFANNAYNNALGQLAEEQPDLDTTDVEAVKAAFLEGVDVRTWVENKATEMCVDFVVTEQKFDELGLTLSDEDKSYLDMMMEYYWSGSQESMERNGISEASFLKVLTSSYKTDAIFEYYYSVGGEKGVTEEELYEYYAENNIRCQYVQFNLTDGEGNMLKSDGKAEMMKMVEGFQKRVEAAYDEGGIEAVMTEMNYVQEDYNYYVTSISEEAAGVEDPATATPRETEDAGTTAEDETAAPEEETASAEESSSAEEESASEEETTEAADNTETEDASGESSEAEESEETTEAEESVEETEETTGSAETEEEAGEETTTTAESDEDGSDNETETEAVTYDNERIISVINVEDYDSEEDISYNPSEKTYKKLLEIKPEDYGKPYIIEEDEQYYLVVRYDIEERMTEDDLWTDNTINTTCYGKYYSDYEDDLRGWSNAASVQRNNAAYKRYNPYKFDFS